MRFISGKYKNLDLVYIKDFVDVFQDVIESFIFHHVCIKCKKLVSDIDFKELKKELIKITDVMVKGLKNREKKQ